MQGLPDASVQTVINDLPYGVTDCAWDKKLDLAAWWTQIDRVTLETGIVVCFATQPFATELINSRRKQFRYDLVWDKVAPVGFLNANRQPLRLHEYLLVFCRKPGQSIYNPQKTPGKPYTARLKPRHGGVYRSHGAVVTVNTGDRHPTSILRHSKPAGPSRLHPTEKPLSLCKWLVLSYSRPGGLILDPTMGSAPVGEAALAAGRRFVGIEQDPEIFQIAKTRLLPMMTPADRVWHACR